MIIVDGSLLLLLMSPAIFPLLPFPTSPAHSPHRHPNNNGDGDGDDDNDQPWRTRRVAAVREIDGKSGLHRLK